MFDKKKQAIKPIEPLKPLKLLPSTSENLKKFNVKKKVVVPKPFPKQVRYSFFQELILRLNMPTPSGKSIGQQLKDGDIKAITITYDKGLYAVTTAKSIHQIKGAFVLRVN